MVSAWRAAPMAAHGFVIIASDALEAISREIKGS
jgi:hypothetical protein